MPPYVLSATEWLNNNQGILALALFAISAAYGWLSGIFSGLRRKPKFRLRVIDGPTFVTVMSTHGQQNGYATHRTAISIYLRVTNIGSAPADIDSVCVGYHWALRPFSKLWLKYSLGWFWLEQQAVAITDFQIQIGTNTKYYPFLTQVSAVSGARSETYLDVGRSTNGVVYFEQPESFGGCFPRSVGGKVRLAIKVTDSFGGQHIKKFWIPRVTLAEARKFNPTFGLTLSTLRGDREPTEPDTDNHGNLIP
ncbi:hypothetical protein RHAB21_03051 [Pseudorhizobium halotolerans]|uniref:DUF4352 domain-containing protein n=1 Tax=Pseudorhizobium halotolerans TaxID=1233081 RepID=A0ABM8PP60_9HYPH|nr:hypothetical protein [Pseudorhizobium halotolerans]CAD7040469.1 hypothetical protein RHAB21_03051 [Pseudorhizobium halotolerans]